MIKLWKANELFYNRKHKYYSNKYARKDTLKEIATKLSKFNPAIGPAEVKVKFNYFTYFFFYTHVYNTTKLLIVIPRSHLQTYCVHHL